MRENLKDVTFLILIRLDSIQRLENILTITELFNRYFLTNVIVREADAFCNGVLKKMLNRNITYEYIEDKDPVLYKTKHFNEMTKNIHTPFLAIWDVDIVPDKKAIIESCKLLRLSNMDVVYPYNGICYDVFQIVRNLFLKKKDIRVLYRHKDKMRFLHNIILYGGGVIIKKEAFLSAGGENEVHYGWGNDDFDRFYRFSGLGFNIYRIDTCLFHLSHPRETNSYYSSKLTEKISRSEKRYIENSSEKEILEQFNH